MLAQQFFVGRVDVLLCLVWKYERCLDHGGAVLRLALRPTTLRVRTRPNRRTKSRAMVDTRRKRTNLRWRPRADQSGASSINDEFANSLAHCSPPNAELANSTAVVAGFRFQVKAGVWFKVGRVDHSPNCEYHAPLPEHPAIWGRPHRCVDRHSHRPQRMGSCLSSKEPLGRATIFVDEKRLSGRWSRMHGLD